MSKLKGVLIDTKNGIKEIELDYNDYHDIVDVCNCSYITCVARNIGGVIVDVYCDEEALLKPIREPAIVSRDKNNKIIEMLFGNCFICKHKRTGNIMSLSSRETKKVMGTKFSLYAEGRDYEVLQSQF